MASQEFNFTPLVSRNDGSLSFGYHIALKVIKMAVQIHHTRFKKGRYYNYPHKQHNANKTWET